MNFCLGFLQYRQNPWTSRPRRDISHSPTQHGIRPQHSTTTLLCSLSQSVLEGFNNRKPATRSLVAAIHISKAFDRVPRYTLIGKILQSDVPLNLKKWLANFISGRRASVSWVLCQNSKSGCSPMACRRVQCSPQPSSTCSCCLCNELSPPHREGLRSINPYSSPPCGD